jgi:general stress protein YciG
MAEEQSRPKQRRGFACMDKARVREIAAIGGRRAHELGVAYTWNSKTATKAGAKGGRVRRRGMEERH